MANPWYTRVLPFSRGQTARGDNVRAELDSVQSAFDLLKAQLPFRFTNADAPGIAEITSNAAARASKIFSTDADGNFALTAAIDLSLATVSSFIETLLDDEDEAAARATLGLTNAATVLHKFDATTAPTSGDDSADGYSVGSGWFDINNDRIYECIDAAEGAAVWKLVMADPMTTRGDLTRRGATGPERFTGTVGQIPRWGGTDVAADDPTNATDYEDLTNGGSDDLSSFDFAIPSWATVILFSVNQVSLSGTDFIELLLGDASSFETSGYVGNQSNSASDIGALSDAIPLVNIAADGRSGTGTLLLHLIDSASNTWAFFGVFSREVSTSGFHVAGVKSLTGPLTRLRLQVSGTDTMDNGHAMARYF